MVCGKENLALLATNDFVPNILAAKMPLAIPDDFHRLLNIAEGRDVV